MNICADEEAADRAWYKADWLNGRMRVFLDPKDDDDVIWCCRVLQLLMAPPIRWSSASTCCLLPPSRNNGLWRIRGLISAVNVIADPPKRGCWWSSLIWDSLSKGLPLWSTMKYKRKEKTVYLYFLKNQSNRWRNKKLFKKQKKRKGDIILSLYRIL